MPRSPSAPARPPGARCLLARSLASALALGLACAAEAPPRPDAAWPDGALLSARTLELRALLAPLESLERTPIAAAARRLREALPDCAEVAARAETPAALALAVQCVDRADAAEGLRAWRGDAPLALALPLGEHGAPRLLLRAQRRGADLHVTLEWPSTPRAADALAPLRPGRDPAGPPVLSTHAPLLHVRMRVDGALDLAALVPPDSQGDQLFRLRGELLSAAVLDGSWELALYPPRANGAMPRVALALGVRLQAAAEAAASRLLDDVEQHWSLRRTPLQRGDDRGACLLALNLLPELAPCYLARPDALVLAWNPPSLERALADAEAGATSSTPTLPSAARAFVDLDALHAVDRQLASLVGDDAVPPTVWPWRSIRAEGTRGDGAVRIEIAFEAAERSARAPAAGETARAGSAGGSGSPRSADAGLPSNPRGAGRS